MIADPTHALHKASFYIERLKFGEGPGKVETVKAKDYAEQIGLILRDAGFDHLDPEQLIEDCLYYGKSYEQLFGVRELFALSIFVDGLIHGLAVAGGLEAPHPDELRP
jgi:hypothetical protein